MVDNPIWSGYFLKRRAVEIMPLRQKTLSPLFHWFAAVTVLAWIGVQALCQAHCLFDACHDESDDADQHATTAVAPHEDGHAPQSDQQDNCEDACCQTLKSALAGNGGSSLAEPRFLLLYTLAPFALTMDATAIEAVASFSRPTRPRKWVFTPEVSLGPAFRSHAPPFSSLT